MTICDFCMRKKLTGYCEECKHLQRFDYFLRKEKENLTVAIHDDQQKYDNCVKTNSADKTLCIVEGVEQQNCTSCPYNLPLKVFWKYQSHNL